MLLKVVDCEVIQDAHDSVLRIENLLAQGRSLEVLIPEVLVLIIQLLFTPPDHLCGFERESGVLENVALNLGLLEVYARRVFKGNQADQRSGRVSRR